MAQETGPYPVPEDEADRLETLDRYGILDTPAEGLYDEIAGLAAEICGASSAAMTLIDADRQWFKARRGIDVEETPREHAFCAHTIMDSDRIMVVEDATDDPRFEDNPLVTGEPGIRFYAGAPIVTPEGHALGSLCVVDDEPRELFDRQIETLETLSEIVAQLLELRRAGREIQEAKQALQRRTEELEESNRELERFAHVVSHDLNNPLTAVIGNLELIESHLGDGMDERTRQRLDDAMAGADRIDAMLDDLLEYARLDTRADPPEPVDLAEVVDAVRTDLGVPIQETGATIEVDDLPTVAADPMQVHQLMLNLVGNAVKFHGETPPRVEIGSEPVDGMHRISVRDHGVGIDPGEQEAIFEIFHRSPATREVEGSGLGLALCNKIVERHGGEIGVESTPGEGSTFSFTLPDGNG